MRQTSIFFLFLTLVSCSPNGSEIEVRVVSTQAHLVSGGDVLIEVVTLATSSDGLALAVDAHRVIRDGWARSAVGRRARRLERADPGAADL